MNILHATTNPDLLTRLKQMLVSADRADIAVGYFFMSGFSEVADDLSRLGKVRILVGRTDRQTLEAVAAGLQQQQALSARLEADSLIRRSHRDAAVQEVVNNIAAGRRGQASGKAPGIAVMPQVDDSQQAVTKLKELIAAGFLEVRPTRADFSMPRPTSAGTTTTPNRAPPLSDLPTSPLRGSPATLSSTCE